MSRPVIAVNCEAARVGGARTYVRALVAAWADNPFLAIFRGTAPGTYAFSEQADAGAEGIDDPLPLLERLRWERRTVPSALGEVGADVLLQPSNISLIPVLPCPRVQIVHNVAPMVRPLRAIARGRLASRLLTLRFLTRRALETASGVVFLSESAYALFRQRGWSGRSAVIRPGAPASPPQDVGREDVVVAVAHLFRYKRVEDAVAGFLASRLSERGYRLDIYGGPYDHGYARGIAALVDSVRPRGAVRLRGARPATEVAAAVARAVAVVQPSACENAPQIVYESLAAGTPVIASDIPAHRELLRSGLYPLGDAETAGRRLREAVSNGLGEQERVEIASWSQVAHDIAAFCEQSVSTPARGT